jgi:hypothetical protein
MMERGGLVVLGDSRSIGDGVWFVYAGASRKWLEVCMDRRIRCLMVSKQPQSDEDGYSRQDGQQDEQS